MPLNPSKREFIERMPKAELHVHLEGSIRPETLLALAKRHQIALPAQDAQGLAEFYRYSTFLHFLDIFKTCVKCLQTPEDLALIASELIIEAARMNVRYVEAFISPTHYVGPHLPYAAVLDALDAIRAEGLAKHGVLLRFNVDIPREFPELAMTATDMAIAGLEHGVVGLSIGGDEANYPPELFIEHFRKAKAAGLRLAAHAGEAAGAASVWGAIDLLGAERIGHGVRSLEDDRLMVALLERAITLDMCPVSNVCTGVVPDILAHPLRHFMERGIRVTLNSDDPPMFNTDLNQEYLLAAEAFDFSTDQLEGLAMNALEGAFLDPGDRQRLKAQFQQEFQTLQAPSQAYSSTT